MALPHFPQSHPMPASMYGSGGPAPGYTMGAPAPTAAPMPQQFTSAAYYPPFGSIASSYGALPYGGNMMPHQPLATGPVMYPSTAAFPLQHSYVTVHHGASPYGTLWPEPSPISAGHGSVTTSTSAPSAASATATTPSTVPPPPMSTATNGDQSSGSGDDKTTGYSASAEDEVRCRSRGGAFDVKASNSAVSERRQLIVKFLTDHTTEQQFKQLFEKHGPVENARIIYDRKTGHTRGFGFITYRHAEDAVKALRTMVGYPLHGRQLNVALVQTERKRAFAAYEFAPDQ